MRESSDVIKIHLLGTGPMTFDEEASVLLSNQLGYRVTKVEVTFIEPFIDDAEN